MQVVRWWAIAVRRHSLAVVRSCIRNCECLCAYKMHRAQQAYSRLWSAPRARALIRALRARTTFMLSASGLALFDWPSYRIPLSALTPHFDDIEQVKELTRATLTCNNCGNRIVVDYPIAGVKYCSCRSQYVTGMKRLEDHTWIPFLERKDILVWRRERSGKPGHFEYKLYGSYPEVSAEIFLQVQIDAEFRKEWDETAVDVRIIDQDPQIAQSHILYWEMQWPRLFANRDYVFSRRYIINNDKKVIVIHNEAIEHPSVPENPNKVRVKDYSCTMVIKPLSKFEESGVEFCMTYFDNPGLSLPQAIQTWVATSAMPEFLIRLRKAAVSYQQKRLSGGFLASLNNKTSRPVLSLIQDAVNVS